VRGANAEKVVVGTVGTVDTMGQLAPRSVVGPEFRSDVESAEDALKANGGNPLLDECATLYTGETGTDVNDCRSRRRTGRAPPSLLSRINPSVAANYKNNCRNGEPRITFIQL